MLPKRRNIDFRDIEGEGMEDGEISFPCPLYSYRKDLVTLKREWGVRGVEVGLPTLFSYRKDLVTLKRESAFL